MNDFRFFLDDLIRDPEFRQEYEALEPEFALAQTLIVARKNSGLTRKELSERIGIARSDISKFENGDGNPSVRTLQRLAAGMGMRVSEKIFRFPLTSAIARIIIILTY